MGDAFAAVHSRFFGVRGPPESPSIPLALFLTSVLQAVGAQQWRRIG